LTVEVPLGEFASITSLAEAFCRTILDHLDAGVVAPVGPVDGRVGGRMSEVQRVGGARSDETWRRVPQDLGRERGVQVIRADRK
jgi:hypothetical protein